MKNASKALVKVVDRLTRYFSTSLTWKWCGTCGTETTHVPMPPFKGKYTCLNCKETTEVVN